MLSQSCQDRDSTRLCILEVVETKALKCWGWQDRDQLRLNKSCWDWYFFESLAIHIIKVSDNYEETEMKMRDAEFNLKDVTQDVRFIIKLSLKLPFSVRAVAGECGRAASSQDRSQDRSHRPKQNRNESRRIGQPTFEYMQTGPNQTCCAPHSVPSKLEQE